jgi:hypothetical protein
MKILLLATLALLPTLLFAQEGETKTFTEQYAGLQFEYPADWKTTKTQRDRVFLSVPVTGSSEPAELQIIHTDFHADKELWQQIQKTVNAQMHREIVRQWEQDILGVPMLFTRINYVDKGVSRSTLTGLYYTRTAQKLLMRLDTREADYDNLEYTFLKALESIRTIDGSTPVADDPAVKLEATGPIKPEPVARPPSVISVAANGNKVELPPQKTELTVSGRKVQVLYPDGWALVSAEDNVMTLKHENMSVPVTITLFTTLDSDSPEKALFRISSESLKLYSKVDMREDTAPKENRAGTTIATVWRSGTAADGNIGSFEATGQAGEDYFILTYRQTDGKALKKERLLLQDLVQRIALEPAP